MKVYQKLYCFLLLLSSCIFYGQDKISDFTSIVPSTQTSQFRIPSTHSFQVISETGDEISTGVFLTQSPDFTAFVPIAGSSTNGYLSLNHELVPGGVTVFDINLSNSSKLWSINAAQPIDFSLTGTTGANCSGAVTPWGTIISCEEFSLRFDTLAPINGYYDFGWNIEIDPATKTVVNNEKLWAMGNFKHENVAIHANNRTVYQGADSNPGYLYKYVADDAQDLTSGKLYVFKGSKNGSGNWVLINNTTIEERNTTLSQSGVSGVDATVFNGIEDVEIGADGWIYFAVKGWPDQRVYRFMDSNPITGTTVATMETYVGNMSYDINDGNSITSVPWGTGNDNLAFDDQGNLWVQQDGGNNYIWVVKNGHTQTSPKVEIFGQVPLGAEPTGITFTPDYKYLFMSIQHPLSTNVANQTDVAGNLVNFNVGASLVIALNENLGTTLSSANLIAIDTEISPNPINVNKNTLNIRASSINKVKIFNLKGNLLLNETYNNVENIDLNLIDYLPGIYIVKINNYSAYKLIIK